MYITFRLARVSDRERETSDLWTECWPGSTHPTPFRDVMSSQLLPLVRQREAEARTGSLV